MAALLSQVSHQPHAPQRRLFTSSFRSPYLRQVTNQARQSGVHPILSVKARRVYVGNLPQGIGLQPKVLQEFFNTALVSAGLVVGDGVPINDVWISSEGRYAFLEMRSPQEATNAMKLDGISL